MLLDLSGRKLRSLHDNHLVLTELSKSNLCFEDITELDVSGCELYDLFGIDLFKNLKTLVASHNNISLLDPLVSLNLKIIKIDHNNLEKLYVKQLRNGMVVLSSDPDNEYTESFLNFGVKLDNYNRQNSKYLELDFVDLSHNSIKFVKNMAYDKKLSIKVLKLCNNNISDFSGLESISDFNTLEVSFNEEFDMKCLENVKLNGYCEINMQSTRLHNEYMVPCLLDKYENMVINHETDEIYHDRLKHPYKLHLNKLKNKKFTRSCGEYAGFIYEGEVSPTELLTPRYLGIKKGLQTVNSNEKRANTISQLETQSTIDNNDDKLSVSALNNEVGEEYNFGEYEQPYEYKTHTFDIGKNEKLGEDPSELNFLISSMELCKKIDTWSDDIKNTLYNNIIE